MIRIMWVAGCLIVMAPACRKGDYVLQEGRQTIITDHGYGTGTTTWTNDNEYLLDGLVFVNDGQELAIEAGTVIRAKTGQGANASALIVARGGRISAEGTASAPIIFTCENDDLEGSVPVRAKGLWGGLIVLGNAPLNNLYNEEHVEGIPLSEPRAIFGGGDEDDDSGILRYVSIRHSGTDIGEGNEINGLTLAGIGRKTVVEYIEIVSANDDGIEFFGGTVHVRNIVVAFCGDDAIDYDMGYRGKGQFILLIQDPGHGDLLMECSGGTYPENGMPFSLPVFSNITAIGRGGAATGRTMAFDRNAGGTLRNSLFLHQSRGVCIEYKPGKESSFDRFVAGDLKLESNLFYDIAGNEEDEVFCVYAEAGVQVESQNQQFVASFTGSDNFISDPGLTYGELYYSVIPSNDIHQNLATHTDSWFSSVGFRGAFGEHNWAADWTLLSKEGIIE